jgi:hypothetical protein
MKVMIPSGSPRRTVIVAILKVTNARENRPNAFGPKLLAIITLKRKAPRSAKTDPKNRNDAFLIIRLISPIYIRELRFFF